MLTLQNGRPADTAGRLPKEIKCYDFLDALGIPYQRLDHAPAQTMEVCAEIDKSLGALICKNLFLSNRQETAFYLLLIPGDKPFKTKYLSAQLGVSRLSFGKEAYMESFLDNAHLATVNLRTAPFFMHARYELRDSCTFSSEIAVACQIWHDL